MEFQEGQNIHIIGIGGAGMSAIARVLLARGFSVQGSDRKLNAVTDALARDGATVFEGHSAAQIKGADMLIITSAVHEDHVEVAAARAQGIPVYKRRDILAPLLRGKTVIAVAGTHGKTTTTSMIAHLLREGGRDPSYIVGGVMANTGTNAGVGQGDAFVIEADEYDDMFLGLEPDTIILTSLEYDHPDFFPSEADMVSKYAQFLALLKPRGTVIPCLDYPLVRGLLPSLRQDADIIGYSVHQADDSAMQANHLRMEEGDIAFDLHVMTGGQININMGAVRVPLPGEHNAANALAAIIAADLHGVMLEDSIAALKTFRTTGRRFEFMGEADSVRVIDDYAHHPTAIRLTVAAARERYPDRAIWALWQPHMYTRTQALIADYATAFESADAVLITDIYAAREAPIPGVDGAWTAAQIQHPNVHHTGNLDATAQYLIAHAPQNAVVIIMSAGDAPQIGRRFLEARK